MAFHVRLETRLMAGPEVAEDGTRLAAQRQGQAVGQVGVVVEAQAVVFLGVDETVVGCRWARASSSGQ